MAGLFLIVGIVAHIETRPTRETHFKTIFLNTRIAFFSILQCRPTGTIVQRKSHTFHIVLIYRCVCNALCSQRS